MIDIWEWQEKAALIFFSLFKEVTKLLVIVLNTQLRNDKIEQL